MGIPRDRYEVVLTDENIESVAFDLKADLVGLSAMTSYVTIYNLFMKEGPRPIARTRSPRRPRRPDVLPMPPILPLKREWREAVLEGKARADRN